MMKSTRIIFGIWLAWALIVIGFQALATARFIPRFPDRALEWTEEFVDTPAYQDGHIYLLEPFMNNQVAWDSEYYLAIALGGYDNPYSPHLTPQGVVTGTPENPIPPAESFRESISLSYAFFPFYPLMIRIFSYPLQIFGLNTIATAALAGVIVSALGALFGMLALYDITRDSLGEDGALRASFYLIVFPTGFFLTQIYTEGLFVGLAFGCLAMLKRNNWLAAAILAICATMTRAVGIVLIVPMLITWMRTLEWMDLDLEWRQIFHQGVPLRPFYKFLLVFSPLVAFLIWKFSRLGLAFDYIEANFFGRVFLSFGYAYFTWSEAFSSMISGTNLQHTAYYITEFLGLIVGVIACLWCVRKYPELGWFSILVFLISWGSGPAQGIHRYILAAPAVFVALASWGRNPAFDRAWTILSLLLMGFLSMLYAFNMWVA